MVEHKMVYSISGAVVSEAEMAQMKAGGIVDFWEVVHAGAAPNPSFVAMCNRQGVSPCFQNGNDGIAGWDGTSSYYQRVAAAGYHAAGGESEQSPEIHSIFANLVFGNFGGDWGGCIEGFSDIFYGYHPMANQNVVGKGMSSWLETYTTFPAGQLCPRVVDAAVNAKKHGSKEAGFMIGYWMPVTAEPYIQYARAMEAKGYRCDGFNVWLGHGSRMIDTYNKWKPVLNTLMAIWPPDMRTLKNRMSGGSTVTTTSITATPITVAVGQNVNFSVKLMAGTTGLNKPVHLWCTVNGVKIERGIYNTVNGVYNFSGPFSSVGTVIYHADFAGDSTYAASQGTVTVNVIAKPLKATQLTAYSSNDYPELNEEITMTFLLRDSTGVVVAGKPIKVSHKMPGGAVWTDGTFTTDATGKAYYKITFKENYCERVFTAVFSGDSAYSGSNAIKGIYVSKKH